MLENLLFNLFFALSHMISVENVSRFTSFVPLAKTATTINANMSFLFIIIFIILSSGGGCGIPKRLSLALVPCSVYFPDRRQWGRSRRLLALVVRAPGGHGTRAPALRAVVLAGRDTTPGFVNLQGVLYLCAALAAASEDALGCFGGLATLSSHSLKERPQWGR